VTLKRLQSTRGMDSRSGIMTDVTKNPGYARAVIVRNIAQE
jgi:hypothetical protein